MKPVAFAYRRPDSVDEALELLAEHGDEVRVLAGGQSLVPRLNQRLERPALVMDINRLGDLGATTHGRDSVGLGALVRQYEMLDSVGAPPLLRAALPFVGHVQTRNRGTICGSLAWADPMGQIPLVALVGGASVQLSSTAGERVVSIEDFLDGPFSPSRRPDELVVGVRLFRPAPRCGHGYAQLDHNVTLGVAAAMVDGTELRVAVATGADRPRLVTVAISAPLDGLRDGSGVSDVAAHAAHRATSGVEFRSDVHADAGYRRALAARLVEQVVRQALDERRSVAQL